MELQTFYPRHPLLKRHIGYYYFLRTASADFRTVYYAFPNTLQAFNIHRSATCTIGDQQVTVTGRRDGEPLVVLQGRYELPMLACLEGQLDKMTINFKPLGLNPFIRSAVSEAAPAFTQSFMGWQTLPEYGPFIEAFFRVGNNAERVSLLEEYLLSIYREPVYEAPLQRAVERLSDFDSDCSVDALARELALTPRSFHRTFYKAMGISPAAFRKIARFRHSMQNKLFSDRFHSLTEIGYNSNFYDQSYFIKMYRKLTGENPTRFFRSVERLADDQLILKFVNG